MSTEKQLIMNYVLAGAEALSSIQAGMHAKATVDLGSLSSILGPSEVVYLTERIALIARRSDT